MGEKHSPGQAHDPTSLSLSHIRKSSRHHLLPEHDNTPQAPPCPPSSSYSTQHAQIDGISCTLPPVPHLHCPENFLHLSLFPFSICCCLQGGVQDCREPEEKHCSSQARPLRVRTTPPLIPPRGHSPEISSEFPSRLWVLWDKLTSSSLRYVFLCASVRAQEAHASSSFCRAGATLGNREGWSWPMPSK